jgi:transcriptional regulator with XRE-family HTH domain
MQSHATAFGRFKGAYLGFLRKWRVETLRMTQVEAADHVGVSRGAYQSWEIGRATIPQTGRDLLKNAGFDGPYESVDAVAPLTPADLVEFRGWITAKFEAIEKRLAEVSATAHEEREALAEMIRALYPETKGRQ